ncbi:hypothetical protein [Thalassospira sp.]|uniref:hypothetical protein n=1 Tax=Thalassospira sp. TaxID=1912094 RepID=UPI0027373359|nr:hypothetical protein [Thalassospira sp.]MDP2699276.1 hypothetical protein [Thalassospira sp.]
MKMIFPIITITVGLLAASTVAQAKGFKAEYCNNIQFLTNEGVNGPSTYPHLHCENRYLGYSRNKNKGSTYDLIDGNGDLNDGNAIKACEDAAAKGKDNLRTRIRQICDQFQNATCSATCS